MSSNSDISTYPELVLQCKNGNEAAFRWIFDHYYLPVKRNIAKFVADTDTAADILQNVFLALWEKKHTLRDDTNIESWLFSVSYYQSVSYIRKTVKSPLSFAEQDLPTQAYGMAESDPLEKEALYASKMHLLQEGINQLSPQKKAAFILYKIKGRTYQEISAEMGISELSARQYVKMSLQFLKQYVRSHELEITVLSYLLVAPLMK